MFNTKTSQDQIHKIDTRMIRSSLTERLVFDERGRSRGEFYVTLTLSYTRQDRSLVQTVVVVGLC